MRGLASLVYGYAADRTGGTEIAFTVPQRPFVKRTAVVGGYDKAASGIAETWTQRRDRLLVFRPVCLEAEVEAVERFVDYCQDNGAGPFLFQWDRALVSRAAAPECYLEEPMPGAEFAPERGLFPGTWLIDLVLRKGDGTQWTIHYF